MLVNGVFRKFIHMRRDRRAAAALEFALVSVPFLGLLLGLMIVAYYFFLQEALDYAMTQSARAVQIGQVPSSYAAADFASHVFCPALAPFASCANVVVTVVPVTDYFSAASTAKPTSATYGTSGGFCTGAPGQTMFARVIYVAPIFSTLYAFMPQATVNGVGGGVLMTSAAFAIENPSATPPTQTNGC